MKSGGSMREAILAAAEKLFFKKGYESTGIQDILDALKLSKGGFYHYFSTKEAVMQEICERRIAERIRRAEPELFAAQSRPVEKMNRLLRLVSLFDWNDTKYAAIMLRLCYGKDGDVRLRETMRKSLREQLRPIMEETIAQGIQAGAMCVRYPKHTGEIVLRMADDLNDSACLLLGKNPESLDALIEITDQVHAYRDAIEVLLGAPFGSIWLFDMVRLSNDIRRVMSALSE